ncbi:hypothetical protein BDZ94DRAFT_1271801 [Collybia nuda]|uniref:Uncharacterized protein n=1 Tax=Collybia nuda TaxID=64659 RepID=A0A9P5XYG8_9AGAR|nr:hypothetical protein BDZ94DRAFT_1271801 [Collybia nuda]
MGESLGREPEPACKSQGVLTRLSADPKRTLSKLKEGRKRESAEKAYSILVVSYVRCRWIRITENPQSRTKMGPSLPIPPIQSLPPKERSHNFTNTKLRSGDQIQVCQNVIAGPAGHAGDADIGRRERTPRTSDFRVMARNNTILAAFCG